MRHYRWRSGQSVASKQRKYENTLGIAHYRSGNWQAALDSLNKSTGPQSGDGAEAFYFTAMSHWQLGNKEEARQWYEKASDRQDKHKPDDAELKRLQAEAAELLNVVEEVDHNPRRTD